MSESHVLSLGIMYVGFSLLSHLLVLEMPGTAWRLLVSQCWEILLDPAFCCLAAMWCVCMLISCVCVFVMPSMSFQWSCSVLSSHYIPSFLLTFDLFCQYSTFRVFFSISGSNSDSNSCIHCGTAQLSLSIYCLYLLLYLSFSLYLFICMSLHFYFYLIHVI